MKYSLDSSEYFIKVTELLETIVRCLNVEAHRTSNTKWA